MNRIRRFEDGLRLVREYQAQKGAYPAKEEKVDGLSLGKWLDNQCRALKKNNLPDIQKEALQGLPGWDTFVQGRMLRTRNMDLFQQHLTALEAHVARHDVLPRQTDPDADVRRLAQWVNSMRKAFHTQHLHPDLKIALERVPHWTWMSRQRPKGEKVRLSPDRMIEMLRAFLEAEKRMPRNNETYEGVPIGTWCCNKRVAHRKDQLSTDLRDRLEALPHWTWEGGPRGGVKGPRAPKAPAEGGRFATTVALLDRFVREHFRLPVVGEKVENFGLGTWCTRVRRLRAQGTLSDAHVALLDAVPMWQWAVRQKKAAEPAPEN